MGTKSFGKGSVQTIQELRSGSAVKLTTARYFTPNGRSIQARGIDPDIILNTVKLSEQDEKANSTFSERDLEGRLSNPDGETAEDSAGDTPEVKGKSLAESDFQLFEALNLLKGLNILGSLNKG